MTGCFITFEGGEGAGKSTQIALLEQWLKNQGKNVVRTREPGGSEGAEEIRSLLVNGSKDRWDRLTELLLFSAARRDHLVKKIIPAVQNGEIVICDRFADSTIAYQCFGYGFDKEVYKQASDLYTLIAGSFYPNLTIILDIDPRVGLTRSRSRCGNTEQRFEDMDISFHENLRRGFLYLSEQDKTRYIVINANQPVEKVHQDILQMIEERIEL